MKLIGITGNTGKTSVCEILYSYLLSKNYRVGVYCTNGIFINGQTIFKNNFSSNLKNDLYEEYLVAYRDDLDYAIVELTEESAYYTGKRKLKVLDETFDVMLNVSYVEYLMERHKVEHYDWGTEIPIEVKCTGKKFMFAEDLKYIPDDYKSFFTLYNDFNVVKYMLNVTTFELDGSIVDANITSKFMLHNLAAAYTVLNELNEYEKDKFIQFIQEILVRGRFELHMYKDKMVMLDTGWLSIDYSLKELFDQQMLSPDNTVVILVPFDFDEEKCKNPYVHQWRANIGKFLKDNDLHTIVTKYDTRATFKKNYAQPNNYTDWEYIPEFKEAFDEAVEYGKHYIYICTNEQYRTFREFVKGETNND